jgi:hypothetical protein
MVTSSGDIELDGHAAVPPKYEITRKFLRLGIQDEAEAGTLPVEEHVSGSTGRQWRDFWRRQRQNSTLCILFALCLLTG